MRVLIQGVQHKVVRPLLFLLTANRSLSEATKATSMPDKKRDIKRNPAHHPISIEKAVITHPRFASSFFLRFQGDCHVDRIGLRRLIHDRETPSRDERSGNPSSLVRFKPIAFKLRILPLNFDISFGIDPPVFSSQYSSRCQTALLCSRYARSSEASTGSARYIATRIRLDGCLHSKSP